MASHEAQQEFDALVRNKENRRRHPEDDDSSTSDVDEHAHPPVQDTSRTSMTATRDRIPKTRFGANTGPKGVISDAQNFYESRLKHRSVRNSTVTLPREQEQEQELKLGQQQGIERITELMDQGNLQDDSDDMDDEFMAHWRQQRLQALQDGGYSSAMHDRSSKKKLYGCVTTVDGEGYLEAIEQSGMETTVVVYICDDTSEVSQLFEDCLRTLAIKHQKSRFIKLDYEEAEIQAAGVPGLIAYRGGDKFAAIIPLLDEMPDDGDLDVATLERVLQRYELNAEYDSKLISILDIKS